MNILQIISSEGYFGAENMMVSLASGLDTLGSNCTVAAFLDSRNPHYEVLSAAEKRGLRVKSIPCRGKWDSEAVHQIRQLARQLRIDVLHTHGYKADLYGFVSAMSMSTSLVATCHNWPDQALAMRAYASIDRFALRKFDQIATASPLVAEKVINSGVPASKVAIIPNGVDMALFHSASPALREELGVGSRPVIGFVGRLVTGKGGAVLLEAAKTVLGNHPEAVFVFAGDGPNRTDWEAAAFVAGIRDSVRFLGNRRDMPAVYASMDVLALPSFDECMPMCVLEAMASGKPVVATSVGAIPEVIEEGRTGRLVPPGDSETLAEALVKMLDHPAQSQRMGMAGQARVEQTYSSVEIARRYLTLYRSISESKTKPRTATA